MGKNWEMYCDWGYFVVDLKRDWLEDRGYSWFENQRKTGPVDGEEVKEYKWVVFPWEKNGN